MSTLATTLVIVSTFMHATWNILVRQEGVTQVRIWRMQLFIVIAGAIPCIASLILLPCISAKAAFCLLGSGASCGLYYVCLERGYESGDFTTVYPASRALPVVLVGLGDALRGRPPSLFGWVGMLFVVFGCFLAPLTSITDLKLSYYIRPVSIWIILTAVGTVGYSLFDKVGTEAIPRGPYQSAIYCYLFYVVAAASYIPLRHLLVKSKSKGKKSVGWCLPATAGTLSFLAYWLVLWAYQMTAHASYIVAFRQFSIVIGVVIAFIVFREPGKVIRFIGSIVITIGLILLKVLGA